MDLDSKDRFGLYFGLANLAVAIGLGSYFYSEVQKVDREIGNYEKMLKQQLASGIPYEKIKKEGIAKDIFVEDRFNVGGDLVKIRQRERHRLYDNDESFFENVSGGSFKFIDMHKLSINRIETKVTNASVFKSALKGKKKEISLFGQAKPIVASMEYTISGFAYLGMIGKLSYNIEKNQFELYPSFIAASGRQIFEHLSGISIYNKLLTIFAGGVFGIVGLVFALPPLKKLIKKWYDKYWRGAVLNEDYYMNKVQYSSDPAARLNCVLCRNRPVEISYECGHVSSCVDCHKKAEERNQGEFTCPFCKKASETFLRVYFA